MREHKVSLTWVLAIVALTMLVAFSLAAVTPLGEQMNALAVTIAGDVVCSQCVGTNGDGTNDIKDASVTGAKIASSAVTSSKIGSSAVTNSKIGSGAVSASKIASNAVTSSKIADGTIGYADVSRSLIAVEHRDDCNCGGTGWDPDGTSNTEIIFDDRITKNSVVAITIAGTTTPICTTYGPTGPDAIPARVIVKCTTIIPDGTGINYAIFNNPAYG